MEELLTPQICMDIDETPLDVGKDDTTDPETASESGEPEMDDDEKVKRLLELKFLDKDRAQVPEELTDFEKEAKKNVFAIGEPAVQFQRLHCTACNIHLGSAPIGHFNRFIHPLLKVLLCKPCYEFYCSGEFDKDEDGSEMYCRWCGQGGKVMCCAQCAYVFCQKCVRQNLGKRTLELIKDSDDWLCFGCNPTQLINLKIICTSLCEFVQEEIRLSKSLNNIERLKADHSVCCQKVKAAKRKREDDTSWDEHKIKKPNILKSALNKNFAAITDNAAAKNWNQKEEAEVVCTPDLPSLMEDDMSSIKPMTSAQTNNTNSILTQELSKAPLNAKDPIPIQPKPIRPEGKKLYTIAPKTNMMMICNTNNIQKPGQNFIRLQSPAIKFVPTMTRTPIVNSLPAQITPGTRHDWYDKAASVVSTINGSLSATLTNLTKEQKNAKTVEQLANIHNKLQELLSSSVNSLIQVRKNLRTEFLADLNKLKFSNSQMYGNRSNNTVPMPRPRPQHFANKENDDDDVIIINSEGPATKPAMKEPPPLVKLSGLEPKSNSASNSRPYLKVRSVSQLLAVSSECITIPDDPPNPSDDVIPVEEKDPLAMIEEIPETPSSGKQNKKSVDEVVETVEDSIKIKNVLAESRIEALIKENMKCRVKNFPDDELRRMLGVRVLLATNFKQILPENRLKLGPDDVIDSIDIEEINEDELLNVDDDNSEDDDKVNEKNSKTAPEHVEIISDKEENLLDSPVMVDDTDDGEEREVGKKSGVSVENKNNEEEKEGEKANGNVSEKENNCDEEKEIGKKKDSDGDDKIGDDEKGGKKKENISVEDKNSDEEEEKRGKKKKQNISAEDKNSDEEEEERGKKKKENISAEDKNSDEEEERGNKKEKISTEDKNSDEKEEAEQKNGNISDVDIRSEEEEKEIRKETESISSEEADEDKESLPEYKESSPEDKESSPEDKESSPEDKESSPEDNDMSDTEIEKNGESNRNVENLTDAAVANKDEEEPEETNSMEENPVEDGASANEEDEEEENSTEENVDSAPTNEKDTSLLEENPDQETKSSNNDVNNAENTKSEVFSTEQVTRDSGIEVDSK